MIRAISSYKMSMMRTENIICFKRSYHNGLLAKEIDRSGKETYYTYDQAHRLVCEERKQQASLLVWVDLDNRLISTTAQALGRSFTTSISTMHLETKELRSMV